MPIPTLADVNHIQTLPVPTPEITLESLPGSTVTTAPPPASEQRAWPSVDRARNGVLVTAPITRFYETRFRNASPRPEVDVTEWRLAVDGWVEKPQSLTYETLSTLSQIEAMRTLECISNPVGGTLIGNTVWQGVRLSDLLERAGVRSGAREIKMSAADGYQTSIPIDLATDPDSLLVFKMNGEPLPVKHGFPARILLPGRYGQKQPKWITQIEVITDEFLGYWEQQGWSNEARVQVNSQIWEPPNLGHVSGRTITVSGIAFADESGVSRVEISTDKGAQWHEAELVPGPSKLVWTEWRTTWELPAVTRPVSVTLTVRATDGNGVRQRHTQNETGILNKTFPDGTSDMHQIIITIEP